MKHIIKKCLLKTINIFRVLRDGSLFMRMTGSGKK